MKTFKEVQKFLSNIDCINCGGCGIAALAMYRWLKKNNKLDRKTKIVYFYKRWDEDDYLNNTDVLKNKKGMPVSCHHAGILYRRNYIDCNGRIDASEYKFLQHINEETFITDSINNINTWNSYFDRGCIKDIESKLNVDLSDCDRY